MKQIAIWGAILGLATAVAAQDPAPFPDFKAKRVKPPGANATGPRITVQIDPDAVQQAPQAASAPEAPGSVPEAPAQRYGWFWDKLGSDPPVPGAGSIEQAMAVLAAAKTPVPAPRLQQMQDLARAHGVDILRFTAGTDVSPALVLAVISVESAGRTKAVSRAGAQGVMQLMPDTAARFGVADSFDASDNIRGGVTYLNWLMREFDRDPVLVLAGYNAGEGAVKRHQGVPPFAETRDYVPKVLAAFQVARGLCLTPPQLASDGCVFAALN